MSIRRRIAAALRALARRVDPNVYVVGYPMPWLTQEDVDDLYGGVLPPGRHVIGRVSDVDHDVELALALTRNDIAIDGDLSGEIKWWDRTSRTAKRVLAELARGSLADG